MGLLERVLNWGSNGEWPERAIYPLSWQQYQSYFTFQGNQYPYGMPTMTLGSKQEPPAANFGGYIGIYQSNPIVGASMDARKRLFSEARFQFRQLRSGRPGELFGSQALAILEQPWPNATTGDLLAAAIIDADLAGNFYAVRRGQSLYRLRPDWVSIVLGSQLEPDDPGIALDATVLGYVYEPGGYGHGEAVALLPEEVCHFAPVRDPSARFRGMSWLTPIVSDLMSDDAATQHKLRFYEQGATVNLVVTFDSPIIKTQEQFDEMVGQFKRGHEGTANAFKTLFLAHGSDAKAIGANMEQADFKAVQGAGETRICMAAGVPPIIVGASEGLAAATYSNYGQARRAFADLTMRPLWRNFAGSVATIIDVPPSSELWYDDRDIPFLQEDVKDAADARAVDMQSIRTGVDAGFDPDTVVDAINAGDLSRLRGSHTGLTSVQLQPPATAQPSANGAPPATVEA